MGRGRPGQPNRSQQPNMPRRTSAASPRRGRSRCQGVAKLGPAGQCSADRGVRPHLHPRVELQRQRHPAVRPSSNAGYRQVGRYAASVHGSESSSRGESGLRLGCPALKESPKQVTVRSPSATPAARERAAHRQHAGRSRVWADNTAKANGGETTYVDSHHSVNSPGPLRRLTGSAQGISSRCTQHQTLWSRGLPATLVKWCNLELASADIRDGPPPPQWQGPWS